MKCGCLGFYLYMQGFWKYLLQRNLSRQWLEGLNYAVFGLGDSGYQKFNVILQFIFCLNAFFLKSVISLMRFNVLLVPSILIEFICS